MKNPLISIYDDVLSMEERIEVYNRFFCTDSNVNSFWVGREELEEFEPLAKLVNLSLTGFDFSMFNGVEIWTHNLTAPGFHYDLDEKFYTETGLFVLPLCSIIYYVEITSQLTGVDNFKVSLQTPDVMIIPKDNRMVVMSPGILHGARGNPKVRKLIAISPWIKKPHL
jgi:hypothetical protein